MSTAHVLDLLLLIPLVTLWAFFPQFVAVPTQYLTYHFADLTVHLPFSRSIEMEADRVGLNVAAKACFDTREASAFWAKMDLHNKNEEIEWMSTHPSHETRRQMLDQCMPQALDLRAQCGYFTGLPTGILTRFYIYLQIAPIAQTLFTYLFLIGGVAFILLSLASAFCIPKNMKRADTNNTWRDDTIRQKMLPKDINKKKSKDNTSNAKEMEVYYCSLLTPSSDKEESDETLERLTSEEYEV